MRRKVLVLAVGGLLFGGAGLANAAEVGPLALTDLQMDQVGAGTYVASWSQAQASVLFGAAATGTRTTAMKSGPVSATGSTSVGVAIGLGAHATSTAGSVVR